MPESFELENRDLGPYTHPCWYNASPRRCSVRDGSSYRLLSAWWVALPLLSALVAQEAHVAAVKLPDGTPVRLELMVNLSSTHSRVGDPVQFRVLNDVKVGEAVVIPKGSVASGHVLQVVPKKRLGRPAKLGVSAENVIRPDQIVISLRGTAKSSGVGLSRREYGGAVGGIAASALGSPFPASVALVTRGSDTYIVRGALLTAFVDGEYDVPPLAGVSPVDEPAAGKDVAPRNEPQ
jgi:hypothetical protein